MTPYIRGGQGRSSRDLEESARVLTGMLIGLAVGFLIWLGIYWSCT